MKKLLTALLMLLSMLALCACGGKDYVTMERAEKTAATGSKWTVLIYMCGGDMESEEAKATECLKDMFRLDYPENINVVVETGGSTNWHLKGIYSDYLQRFEIQKGGMVLADQKITDNMGNYRTLQDFLSWGVRAYPAEHYMTVIWDHGGGSMTGAAFDELYNNDCLNLEELSYAISLSGVKFDIIGFDASLMASLETASALAQYGDYMIASAEYSPVCWDYETAFECLINNPDVSAGEISKVICDSIYAKCEEEGADDIASISVTDLSKISTLSQAFDGLAGVMLTAADGLANCAHLQRNLEYTHVYGANTPDEGYTNMVDLGNLASIVQEDTGTTSDILGQTLDEAVIYTRNGKYHDGASGLGVFYPLDNNAETVEKYIDIATSNNYKKYLRSVVINPDSTLEDDYHSSWAWLDYMNEMQSLNCYAAVNEDEYYELGIEGSMDVVKGVGVDIYRYDEKSGAYAYLFCDENPDSLWDSGLFTYNTDTVPMLNGHFATINLVGWGGAYKIYSIPAVVNGEQTNIRVAYNPNEQTYEVIGAWGGIDSMSGKADRYLKKLKITDRITTVLRTREGGYAVGESFMVGIGGAKVREKKLKGGEYMLKYDAEDIYGNSIDVSGVLLELQGTNKYMHQ